MKKSYTKVAIINATELQRFEDDPAKRLVILEDEINKRLYYLENEMANAIGTRFTAEILNVQMVDINIAIVTMKTKQL